MNPHGGEFSFTLAAVEAGGRGGAIDGGSAWLMGVPDTGGEDGAYAPP